MCYIIYCICCCEKWKIKPTKWLRRRIRSEKNNIRQYNKKKNENKYKFTVKHCKEVYYSFWSARFHFHSFHCSFASLHSRRCFLYTYLYSFFLLKLMTWQRNESDSSSEGIYCSALIYYILFQCKLTNTLRVEIESKVTRMTLEEWRWLLWQWWKYLKVNMK